MWRALVTAIALAAAPALGADSDCFRSYQSGAYHVIECYLCDGDHSATDCAELTIPAEVPGGLFSHAVADLARATGCAGAVAVDVRGLSDQLGMPHVYGTLTAAGTSSLRLLGPRHTYLDADVDITTSAGCTDLEVPVRFYYRRVQR